ncbi:unnamed protein product, partial [Polarella glacialis]
MLTSPSLLKLQLSSGPEATSLTSRRAVEGRFDKASAPSSSKDWTSFISEQGRQSRWQEAWAALSSLRRQGIEAKIIHLNAAVSACVRGQQWSLALQRLRGLRHVGLEPDEFTCGVSISAA